MRCGPPIPTSLLLNPIPPQPAYPTAPLLALLQVAATCRDLRKYSGLRTACITGGTDRQQQVEALGKQVRRQGSGGKRAGQGGGSLRRL